MNSRLFSHITFKKYIYIEKKSSTIANLLEEKPGIDLLLLTFFKQAVYKQLALTWQIASSFQGSTFFH